MLDGRRNREPPWWWRTEVFAMVALVLIALLAAAWLFP
jgi:hypothetical protein